MRQWKQSAKGLILAMVLAVGLCGMAHATPGDVNGDDAVSLEDAVISLQAGAGLTELEIDVDGDWDIGGDDAVGLAEAVYAMRDVAENSGEGDTFTNSLGMTFVRIPAGTFMMGSPEDELGARSNEWPRHQVTLSQDFYMMTTEVTQAQWEAVMGSNPSYFDTCGVDCPVEYVSWNDIQDFIAALNAMDGRIYRLPTEAEWEYAARAGTTTAFYNGGITELYCGLDPNLDAIGWYCGNDDVDGSSTTHPVARKQPNAWGLYDMSGNVWEWCQDWYGTYPTGAVSDPGGPSTGSYRVLRGGSLYNVAPYCRSAYRRHRNPSDRYDSSGFRLALSPSSDTLTDNSGLGMTFVRIPAGTFTMGSPTDEPGRDSDETQHQVTLTQDFYMMTTEVTQTQWEAVMGSNPSYYDSCGGDCPVETVSWNDIQDFIAALNAMDGRIYRLPTEAEWEYAARAGTTTAFYNGRITETGCTPLDPNLDAIGWYCGNADSTTHPVAQKQPNAWGLYDMSGNVYEWCQDWHGPYPTGAVMNPTGPADGSYRVLRGGGWRDFARNCRSADRNRFNPSDRHFNHGFRLAVSPSQ